MVSFLNKLKGSNVNVDEDLDAKNDKEAKKNIEFSQVDVDIFQTSSMYVIYAAIPGVDISQVDLSIENENDVVTIQGRKDMPMDEFGDDKKYLRQELKWGEFYRQIILPQEINVSEVQAKFEKGIMVIKLPILRLQGKGKKKIKIG